MPTPMDAVIRPEDVLLLHHAYSERMGNTPISALIKRFPAAYGLSLSSPSLRHAVLALSALYLPSRTVQHRQQQEYHYHEAQRALLRKLTGPTEIQDVHALSAFLLAIFAFLPSPANGNEILIHGRGCLSMLTKLANDERLSFVLGAFGPLLFDYITLIEHWVESSPDARIATFESRVRILGEKSWFIQRLEYIRSLRIDNEGTEWDSNIGRAIHFTIIYLFDMLFRTILEVADSNEVIAGQVLITHLRSQIDDPAFQAALVTSSHWRRSLPVQYLPDSIIR